MVRETQKVAFDALNKVNDGYTATAKEYREDKYAHCLNTERKLETGLDQRDYYFSISGAYQTANDINSDKLKNSAHAYKMTKSFIANLNEQASNRIQTLKDFYIGLNPDQKLLGGPDPVNVIQSETNILIDPFLSVEPDFEVPPGPTKK